MQRDMNWISDLRALQTALDSLDYATKHMARKPQDPDRHEFIHHALAMLIHVATSIQEQRCDRGEVNA